MWIYLFYVILEYKTDNWRWGLKINIIISQFHYFDDVEGNYMQEDQVLVEGLHFLETYDHVCGIWTHV